MFDAQKITAEIHGTIDHHLFWLLQSRYIGGADITPLISTDDTPVSEIVTTLAAIANGDVQRESAEQLFIAEALEGIQQLCETLFTPAFGGSAYTIPDSFWQTELGQLIVTVQAWAEERTPESIIEDKTVMLTPSEVAEMKGVNEQTVRLILRDKKQRAEFFPGAKFVGKSKQGYWQIPRDDAEAWKPRARGRQPTKKG